MKKRIISIALLATLSLSSTCTVFAKNHETNSMSVKSETGIEVVIQPFYIFEPEIVQPLFNNSLK